MLGGEATIKNYTTHIPYLLLCLCFSQLLCCTSYLIVVDIVPSTYYSCEELYSVISLPPLQTEYACFENGRFVYRISRSPMCEYMINFIHKLKHLPEKYMMNSVLENFTILLVRIACSVSMLVY